MSARHPRALASSRREPRRQAERGAALVAVVLLLVVGVGLIAVSLTTTSTRSRETFERDVMQRLQRAAENAIALKAHEMSTRGDEQPLTVTVEGVTVVATPFTPANQQGRKVIDAVAAAEGLRFRLAGALEEIRDAAPLFDHAIYGGRSLTINGGVATQSFDGKLGLPSGANIGAEGHIGSNGALTIGPGGAIIDGSVFHVEGQTASIDAGAKTGTVESMPEPRPLPDLIETTMVDARAQTVSNPVVTLNGAPLATTVSGDLVVGKGGTLQLPAGTYVLNSLTVQEGATATFTGDVKIVAKTVTFDTATVSAGSNNVEVYYDQSLAVKNGSTLAASPDADGALLAQRFAAYGAAGATLEIVNAQARGTFYAPEGDATLRAPLHVEGTVVGRDVTIQGAPLLDGDDLGLPGGHFDVDVWYRKKDGKMDRTKNDYHEHEYDDSKNTDTIVFTGSAQNGITGKAQSTETKAKWADFVAAQGSATQVEMVFGNLHHGTGNLSLELKDGTRRVLDARSPAEGVRFAIGDVKNLNLRYLTLAQLIGTEPGDVRRDTVNRGKENVPLDPKAPKKGSWGMELYRVKADGTRGELLYEFRTYFHNNTGKPWPPSDGGSGQEGDAESLTSLVRFDTSLRDFRQIPLGETTYRLRQVFPLPLDADVGQTVGDR